MSAMIDSECLLLRNGTTSENEGNGTLRVTLLQEMDTKIKPSKKGEVFFTVSSFEIREIFEV